MKTPKNRNIAFIGLAIIFVVLLLQSCFSMFVETSQSESITQMDIIFRTSLSSIFGFLMSNFATSSGSDKTSTIQTETPTIGFSSADTSQSLSLSSVRNADDISATTDISVGTTTTPVAKAASPYKMQILILIGISLFCIISLIVVRNFSYLLVNDSSTSVTIALYRDFTSGTIGALIGLSRN